jgi:hypothetical protein
MPHKNRIPYKKDPLETLYINCTFLTVYRICADEKGLPRPPTIESADLIIDLIVRGSSQPFFVCTCSVHNEKCTVYVKGLEWGFFVRYSVFARHNSFLTGVGTRQSHLSNC